MPHCGNAGCRHFLTFCLLSTGILCFDPSLSRENTCTFFSSFFSQRTTVLWPSAVIAPPTTYPPSLFVALRPFLWLWRLASRLSAVLLLSLSCTDSKAPKRTAFTLHACSDDPRVNCAIYNVLTLQLNDYALRTLLCSRDIF